MPNRQTLKSLYYQALRIRMVEESIAKKYPGQEIRCPVHLCIGQEGIAVGVCANLEKEDVVMSNHRSHGHYLARGGSLPKMIAELYGKKTGCSKGRGGSQHLIDLTVNFYGSTPIVGGTIPVATGVAWASKMRKLNKVVVVFMGDAAVEEGIFHESLNFAALHKLPILFICENNFYSIVTHISQRQPSREIFTLSLGQGVKSFQEDGNDVIKVYNLTKKAVQEVRKGKGPVFLEFLTYRWKEHCGPNDELPGIRPQKELIAWKRIDPLQKIRNYLIENSLMSQTEMDNIKGRIQKEIDYAFSFALKSPFPSLQPSVSQLFA